MNRNELEQWMKDSLGKQEFLPREEGWDKLQAALHPAAKEDRKKGLILLLPAKLKAAATIALLASAGTAAYLLTNNNPHNETSVARHTDSGPVITSTPSNKLPQTEDTHPTPSSSVVAGALPSASPVRTITYHKPSHQQQVPPDPQHNSTVQVSQPIAHQEPAVQTPIIHHEDPIPTDVQLLPDMKEQARDRHINVGVAAQFGKVSVGNMQYQVGVVACKNISNKFYAKATLALAATDVGFTQPNNFKSFTASSFGNSIEDRKVDAHYRGNIYSVGLAPNIGYRITSRFAVSCGVAVYRNLEQSVSLENKETVAPGAFADQIVNSEKSINTWDAGVTGSAMYQAGRRLSVEVQYRHGISAYMYTNNQPIRNSGVGIGLSYLFGR